MRFWRRTATPYISGQDGSRAIHGFGLASQFYFGKSLEDLDLHQIALLVGMIKGPSLYDPRKNPERAKERRALVLDVMVEQNLIPGPRMRWSPRRWRWM